jgi:hypothetical protein
MFLLLNLLIFLAILAKCFYAGWWYATVPQPARIDERLAYTKDALILKAYACKQNLSINGKAAPKDVMMLADQGNLVAQIEAAQLLFAQAKKDPKHYKSAVIYLENAAEHGIPAAQNAYGVAVRDGLGDLTVDKLEAFKWFSLAAGRGLMLGDKNAIMLSKDMSPEELADAEHRAALWMQEYLNRKPDIIPQAMLEKSI